MTPLNTLIEQLERLAKNADANEDGQAAFWDLIGELGPSGILTLIEALRGERERGRNKGLSDAVEIIRMWSDVNPIQYGSIKQIAQALEAQIEALKTGGAS